MSNDEETPDVRKYRERMEAAEAAWRALENLEGSEEFQDAARHLAETTTAYFALLGRKPIAAVAASVRLTDEQLSALARDIEGRLWQASRYAEKSTAFRAAAGLQLATAQSICEQSGINFRVWAQHNIRSTPWEFLRLLLKDGAPDAAR